MKNKVKYILVAAAIMLGLAACKDPGDIFEEFRVPNGLIYPGQAMNVFVRPGDERIEIVWNNGADPKVVKAKIFWNNYTDTLELDITANMDTVRQLIAKPRVQENTYSFMIHTYDAAGNSSVPVEVIGRVYGAIYRSTLTNRFLASTSYVDQNVTLFWSQAAESVIRTELDYWDLSGNNVKTEFVSADEDRKILNNFDIDKPLLYRTIHKPDVLALDEFYAGWVTRTIDPNSWWNITDDPGMLRNAKKSFERGDHTVLSGRYADALHWQVNDEGKVNGNVDANFANRLLFWTWNGNGGSASTITNAKLWQTIELAGGTYRFIVYSDGTASGVNTAYSAYLMVALGDEIPDIEDVATAKGATMISGSAFATEGVQVAVEFEIEQNSYVSLGIVGTFSGQQQIYIERVELWQYK